MKLYIAADEVTSEDPLKLTNYSCFVFNDPARQRHTPLGYTEHLADQHLPNIKFSIYKAEYTCFGLIVSNSKVIRSNATYNMYVEVITDDDIKKEYAITSNGLRELLELNEYEYEYREDYYDEKILALYHAIVNIANLLADQPISLL